MAKRLSIILVGIVALLFLLSGCSVLRALIIDERKENIQMAERIVSALDAKDEEALKGLLSKKTIEEASDLNEGIAYTMDLYKGSSIKFEDHGSYYSDHYGSPGRSKHNDARFDVWTDEGQYVLYFEFWLMKDDDPDMLGVYRMSIVTIEDDDEDAKKASAEKQKATESGALFEWNYGATYNRPGIYHPGWEDELPPDVVTE
jgi:hypothetical protein